MKTSLPYQSRLKHCGKLAAFAFAILTAHGSINAQENIVALGRVNAAGGLTSSDNTVNGVVVPVRNAVGDYTVTVTAVGAFTGSDVNDYAAQATINAGASGDTVIKVGVTAVTNNAITLEVNVDDVENTATPNDPVPADANFNFVLFRIPDTASASATTSHLLSAGRVDETGLMRSSIGRDGIVTVSAPAGPGSYNIVLSKAGGFTADTANDYVVLLTLEGVGAEAYAIRGDVIDVTGDGQVVINVRTDDVQAPVDLNTAVPTSRSFYFSVYQTTDTPVGTVDTEALVSHARVNAAGAMLSSTNSFDGGTISSSRLGTGSYRVIMTSSGAYTNRTAVEYVVQATLNQTTSEDDGIAVEVIIVNNNTMQIDVSVNDLETSGQAEGVPQDAGFYLTVLDTVGDVRPDLLIGERRSLTQMRGDNVYGRSGRGQSIDRDLVKKKWSKYFFALENDGNVADRVRLKETGRTGSLKTKYFRLTDGRTNITGQMTRAGYIEASLDPDEAVLYQGLAKYRSLTKRPNQSIRILANSLIDRSKVDAVRINTSSDFRSGYRGSNDGGDDGSAGGGGDGTIDRGGREGPRRYRTEPR